MGYFDFFLPATRKDVSAPNSVEERRQEWQKIHDEHQSSEAKDRLKGVSQKILDESKPSEDPVAHYYRQKARKVIQDAENDVLRIKPRPFDPVALADQITEVADKEKAVLSNRELMDVDFQEELDKLRAETAALAKLLEELKPKPLSLADHLREQPEDYLRKLLVDVDYDYTNACRKLMSDELRLNQDDVKKNLNRHMVTLRNDLQSEVQTWFNGNGRLLNTGPEIVDCFIACSKRMTWHISEMGASSGCPLVETAVNSRIAYHLIVAADILDLEQEQKVLCLHNLTIRR